MDLAYEQNGTFSVISAYRLLQISEQNDSRESSNENRLHPVWMKLWMLKFPLKVRIFIWKACCDYLPTFQNLQRRNVNVDNTCRFCHHPNESILHALWDCPDLKPVWNMYFAFQIACEYRDSFLEIVCLVSVHG